MVSQKCADLNVVPLMVVTAFAKEAMMYDVMNIQLVQKRVSVL